MTFEPDYDPALETDEVAPCDPDLLPILNLIGHTLSFDSLRRLNIIIDTATMPFDGSPTTLDAINYALNELNYTDRLVG
jgi:hypothetical protein